MLGISELRNLNAIFVLVALISAPSVLGSERTSNAGLVHAFTAKNAMLYVKDVKRTAVTVALTKNVAIHA